MHDAQMSSEARLEMHWVPVTDSDGRTRMRATWVAAAPAPAPAVTTHHAA